eukprot:COSAG01_NODE_1304_length_10809_cov_2.635387_9_plen_65_part_00
MNSGQLPDPQCKNTVAQTSAGLVHGGSHSVRARTNVSALFSTDAGKRIPCASIFLRSQYPHPHL